jgi:hypothetical protein
MSLSQRPASATLVPGRPNKRMNLSKSTLAKRAVAFAGYARRWADSRCNGAG